MYKFTVFLRSAAIFFLNYCTPVSPSGPVPDESTNDPKETPNPPNSLTQNWAPMDPGAAQCAILDKNR